MLELEAAWQDVGILFDRFYLVVGAMERVQLEQARLLTGQRHGSRWKPRRPSVGHDQGGRIGLHGDAAIQRPRVRGYGGQEVELLSWTVAQAEHRGPICLILY